MAKALQKYFHDEAECGDDDNLAYLELDEEMLDREQAELDRQMVGFFILWGKWRRGRRGEVKCVNIFFSYFF